MNTRQIAENFLTLLYKNPTATEWTEAEKPAALALLQAAGFKVRRLNVVRPSEKPKLELFEKDINGWCCFAVEGEDEQRDDYWGTSWLSNLVFSLKYRPRQPLRAPTPEEFPRYLERLVSAIERSIPYEPITLTPDGDQLIEPMPYEGDLGIDCPFKNHTRDESKLHEYHAEIGFHSECGGRMYSHKAPANKMVLVCDQCHLRATYPRGITTYGELKAFFHAQRKEHPAELAVA